MSRHPHHENPDPTPEEVRAHAVAARARKRADAEAIGIDAEFVSELVESFYAAIRADALLGPIFAERIEDWPAHLGRMKSFWRSILQGSGEYAGNPMAKHLTLPGLDARHFAHWLELFYAALRALERHPAATRLVGARADDRRQPADGDRYARQRDRRPARGQRPAACLTCAALRRSA